MNDKAEQFYQQLQKAVETDQLKLPSLPEVALNVRNAIEKETSSAEQIAEILAQDPALSIRLLQLANSPLYRPRAEITSLQMAITRLGIRVVRDLIITIAIKQIYKAGSDTLQRYFRELWSTSVEVAAISRTLACNVPGMDPEQALLAGLIHNIGALPVLQLAEQDHSLLNNNAAISRIVEKLQNRVGKLILEFWHLPSHLVQVVSQWNDFHRSHTGTADYVDIVQVAILQSGHASGHNIPEDWTLIPAMAKLGIDSHAIYQDSQPQIHQIIETLINT